MAATNYTPIQLYRTTTAAAQPNKANLADGELAINTTDEKLYFKNAGGTVKLLASSAAATASGTVTSIDVSGGTTGLSTSGGPVTTSGTITLAGTLAVANGGTGVTSSTGTGSVVLSSSPALTDPSIVGTVLEDIYTIVDGAAFEIDPGNGSIQLITLGASRTPKATNFTAGEAITMMIDDGSAYTITWTDASFGGSGVVWKTDLGSAPTLNTTGYTAITLWKVGTQVYGARVGDA